jgi:hypothetical protein
MAGTEPIYAVGDPAYGASLRPFEVRWSPT